ncbi:hypothetical protein LAZ67_17001046 [Cordylochernes scorpioides]|uniref:RNA-directed DNA polymerase n=1 Tax=Cordylochernes scorpioides TaxID=51811 RepID=A0ABY6LHV2_9ARAC|nr:hypothetical protein LAZ67_17001046 [Cordylochernes scorpioides]
MPKKVSVHRHSSPTYHTKSTHDHTSQRHKHANVPHNTRTHTSSHNGNTHNPHNTRNTHAKRQQQRQTSACTTVKNNTIIPSTQNIEKIHATKQPHNRKALRSFLKAVNAYKEFIPDHARLRTPLINLLKKDIMWVWDDECQKAFTNLKENLTTHPTLHLYKEGLPCQVYCDASTLGIAGILKQAHPDGNVYPVQYFSRTLRPHEKNYSISELECLAIVESVEKFRIYLMGRKFTIFSDHHALQWLKTIKNPSGRLFRWSLRLSSYEYEVRYIKGKLQYEADLLSRNPFCGFLDATLIKNHQPPPSKESSLTIDHNGLHTVSRKGVTKIILPKPLIQQLLQTVHTQYNHPGISQMSRIISTQYYWQGMSKDIKQKVKTCPTCQLTKRPVGPTYGELSQPPESKEPFDLLSLDTIAGFAKYGNTKTYLHVVVDHFSRYAWAFPSKSTSTTTYQQVLKRIFQDGFPKRLLTDRAPAFTSPKFRSFLLNRNIHPLLTTSNNPQANGLCERLNATLTGKLRLLHLENPKVAWTKLVKKVTLIYNKTPHSTTGFPPIYLMFGILPPEISNHNTPYPDIDKARKIAHTRTQNKHLQDKNTYDQRHKQPHFEVGDLVLVKLYHHPNTGKLAPYFIGPHTILEIISPNVVRIDRPNQPLQRDTDTIHVNKLKLYTEKIHYISPPTVSTYHIKHNPNYTFPFKHLTPELFPTESLRFKPTSSEPFKHLDPAIFATRRFTSLFPDVKNCKPDNQLNHITPLPKDIKQENCEPTNHSNSTIYKVILPDDDILGVVASQTSKPDDDSLLPGMEDRAIGRGTVEREGTIVPGSTFRQRGAKPRALPPFRITRPPKLRLSDKRPVCVRPYRHSLRDWDLIKRQIEQLLKYGLIKPASSPYSAPVTLAPKKGERRVRLCIDYRLLNRKIISDSFPIPLMENIVQKVQGARVFSCLDILSAYWTIPLHPKDREVTCFSTSEGSYVWITYLGYEISKNQISPSGVNVDVIKSLPPPRDLRCLRSFLGSVTHLAKFIKNFNNLRAPLNELLKKNSRFIWKDECQRSFEDLKEALCSKPILQLFNPSLATHIYCDASISGIGAVLKQEYPDGTQKPFTYFSRALRGAESKYTITELELLAHPPSYGLMGSLPRAAKPFDVVALDTVLGLGGYNSAKNCIHTVIDHHSRYIWGYASKGTSIATYMNIINQLLNIGKPRILVTDRHPSFVSKRFNKFLQEKGIKHVMTSLSHPECNGLLERANATLIGRLKIQYQGNPRAPWPKLLQKTLEEYRNTPHSTTTFPPIYLLYGTLPSYISDLTNPYPPVEKARTIDNEKTEELHKRLVKRYNSSHRFPNLKIGDKVLYRIPHQVGHGKLSPVYYPDPYTVLSTPSPHIVEINKPCQPENKPSTIVDVSKLKLWDPISTSNEGMGNYPFPFQDVEDLNRCL